MVKMIISDIFGTLFHIPSQIWYKPITDFLIVNGVSVNNLRELMKHSVMFSEDNNYGQDFFYGMFGVLIPINILKESQELMIKSTTQVTIDRNLVSLLTLCRNKNINLVLCSNLVTEFVPRVRKIFSNNDLWLSCETGLLKPDASLLKTICDNAMYNYNITPQEICILGNSFHSDIAPALLCGLNSYHIHHSSQLILDPLYHNIKDLKEFISIIRTQFS